MKIKITHLSILLIFVSLIGFGQSNPWSKATNWQIHDVKKRQAFLIPLDSLKEVASIRLDDAKVNSFLSRAKELPKESNYFWIGLFVATCETASGKPQKVIFSNYGGFLYDERTKSYFEIPEEYRKEWLEYLNEKVTEMNANIHKDGNRE